MGLHSIERQIKLDGWDLPVLEGFWVLAAPPQNPSSSLPGTCMLFKRALNKIQSKITKGWESRRACDVIKEPEIMFCFSPHQSA